MPSPSPVPTPPNAKAAVVVIFHHVDPAHEPAVREYLTAESLLPGYFEPMTDQLHYDEGYGKLAADMTACAQISDAIAALDPHAVFEVCQDPGVNFAGERIVVHPELGCYRSAADEGGTARVGTSTAANHLSTIRAAVTTGEGPELVLDLLDGLDRVLGGPWERDIRARLLRRHPHPTPPDGPAPERRS